MKMWVRDFTPDDCKSLVDVTNAVFQDSFMTLEEWRYLYDRRTQQCMWRRWVFEADGNLVAWCEYLNDEGYDPGEFRIRIYVLPEHEGRGIGKRLYEHLMAALGNASVAALFAMVREDKGRAVRFVEDRGFKEDLRIRMSKLDVESFDFAPYRGIEEQLSIEGIQINTFAELGKDTDRDRKLFDLTCELLDEISNPERYVKPSFQHFVKSHEDPGFLPEASFIAVRSGQYVGRSDLNSRPGGRSMYTGLTGVRRDHRGKGIATGLKLTGIRWCASNGYTQLWTDNDPDNLSMIEINDRLGFMRQPAVIRFSKVVKQTESSI